MTTERAERRLAAIFAADVVGYSRLVSADEEGTLSRLGTLRRDIIEANIDRYSGRLFKIMGDGFLAEFASAVQAVSCALAIQTETEAVASGFDDAQKMRLRIGIHVGDVLVTGEDLMGDGINIAARLESIAAPGGISISRAVHDQIRDRIKTTFDDKGEVFLKNIARPVQVFAVAEAKSVAPIKATPSALALPNRPSIAVLPFQNMSGDPEQEYFADGVVEDIITALSRFKTLFVIARNSSFTYKGKAVDVRKVGSELGVRYVLEGSVRKAGGRVRITGQLIDSATGAHIWADRFDGELHDVFELQDQITTSVLNRLLTHVQIAEIERANRKPSTNLHAYDCYWRGLSEHWKQTKSSNDVALVHFLKAIDLDQNFSSAYGMAAIIFAMQKQNFWLADVAQDTTEAIRLARRAIELGPTDETALCRGGHCLGYLAGELDFAAECIRRGLAINPNYAGGWSYSAWTHQWLGDHQSSLADVRQWERLSPCEPTMLQGKMISAFAHVYLGNFEEAARLAQRIIDERPNLMVGWRLLAISRALAGDVVSAKTATKKAMELDPSLTASGLVSLAPLRRAIDIERLKEGYTKAGFPA
ncbi:adenylate/guanylate cyclase domain-containing protein [Bradyrhizobium frederickii]|uniref:adenylate/guanylate cyclase domain-containing protein n=1 Tax=Bradyrhizobium frederickii TaxID=2560054 RepID=UPI00142FD132|nr:adenylate/guanylate cyclase domain-containing protein [Bradyrhizobium frederickii]